MIKIRILAIAAGLLGLSFLLPTQGKDNSGAEFIWLSDLHFDPTANPMLVDALAQASVEEWPRLLASSPPATFPAFGQDTNWALLSSSFGAIRRIAPDSQFAVVTGDLLVHHFYDKFRSTAKDHDEESFRLFARKTMQFISLQLAALVPGRPVLLALGNNDSECGNYELEPQGAFLKATSSSIADLLGRLADQTVIHDWIALGSYSVPHPALKGVRVIAVNSVFFSPRYRNTCSPGQADPASEEMRWLEGKLAEARRNRDRVWLIFHIPPGIDGYASSHAAAAGSPTNVVPMWKPTYTEQFRKLLERYHKTMIISLAGHEHTDDFRLIGDSLVLMTPAVSPEVGQNPAFRTVNYQPNGTLSDQTTYYLSNLDTLSSGAVPEWKREYNFVEMWGLHGLNFHTFSRMEHEVETESEALDRWSRLYSVSRPEGKVITPQTFPALFCVTSNTTEETFDACVEQRRAKQ